MTPTFIPNEPFIWDHNYIVVYINKGAGLGETNQCVPAEKLKRLMPMVPTFLRQRTSTVAFYHTELITFAAVPVGEQFYTAKDTWRKTSDDGAERLGETGPQKSFIFPAGLAVAIIPTE